MLNKMICKQCWNTIWFNADDLNWENHRILCAQAHVMVSILKDPPEECPYLLEHLMKGQDKC